MSRLPTRVRLTVAFAVTMLIVLAILGGFVYERFASQITGNIDLSLSTQSSALLALIRESDAGLERIVANPLVRGHQNFVQVLDAKGQILAATPGLEKVPLLDSARLERALRHSELVTRGVRAAGDPLPEGSRLLATPVRTQTRGRVVVIVGTSLDQRSNSLDSLVVVLAIAGPLALLLASFAAFVVASAALGPVELMRRQAAEVSATDLRVRLPLPPADDEIRRLGVTLNEMLERLEISFTAERAFVANASHELRTPLATLTAELELALRRERPAEELREALRSAQDEVDRLSALAEDLLVLARADAGRLPLTPTDIEVRELFERARERIDPSAARVNVGDCDGLRVIGDPRRLDQALHNLLDNALRYSSGAVRLSARGAGEAVELHVLDDGPGFPPQFIVHAFDRFSRADPARAERGAGLGLSIVRTIAQGHGGESHATNRIEGGADVWVVIPSSPGEQ